MNELSLDIIPVDKIPPATFDIDQPEISVLRLDTIHPVISGNKWFKLRYYLEDAISSGKKHIITFGGAWSNHIAATAAICRLNGLESTGIIRGEEPSQYSATLMNARESGMNLAFVSREDYKLKKIPAGLSSSESYVIPEGGYGEKGAKGATHILDHCDKNIYSHIVSAAGTGTMLAGLINAANAQQEIFGISVLKNNIELDQRVQALLKNKNNNYRIIHDFHFGGYAKYTDELISFMNEFYNQTGIPTDFVYTGKLFYGIAQLFREKIFTRGVKLLVIHSGGLQGNASLKNGTLIF